VASGTKITAANRDAAFDTSIAGLRPASQSGDEMLSISAETKETHDVIEQLQPVATTNDANTKYGMRLSQLTPEHMGNILDVYGRVAEVPESGRMWTSWTPAWHVDAIKETLSERSYSEWRYGSGLTDYSRG